jgi:hypothetical protein
VDGIITTRRGSARAHDGRWSLVLVLALGFGMFAGLVSVTEPVAQPLNVAADESEGWHPLESPLDVPVPTGSAASRVLVVQRLGVSPSILPVEPLQFVRSSALGHYGQPNRAPFALICSPLRC